MELANNLKQARLAKNMSQEELAALIGKSKNVISNWERGDNKPDADVIFSLCDILNVDANYLLGWERNNSFSISITEQSLIKKYRSLDSYGSKAINNLLEVEYERCNTVIEEYLQVMVSIYSMILIALQSHYQIHRLTIKQILSLLLEVILWNLLIMTEINC